MSFHTQCQILAFIPSNFFSAYIYTLAQISRASFEHLGMNALPDKTGRVKALNLEYFLYESMYGLLKDEEVWCTKMEAIYICPCTR